MPDRAAARTLLLSQKNVNTKQKQTERLISRSVSCFPVPSGLPHRSHCVPINMNRLIPVIFSYNLQLFEMLNFWRFIKTHNLTHTGKGAESIGQGQTGNFLTGPVFFCRTYRICWLMTPPMVSAASCFIWAVAWV